MQKIDKHLTQPARVYLHDLDLASATIHREEPAVFGPPRKSRNSGAWSIS